MTSFLSLDDVLAIHQLQIETYGGQSGVRDLNLVESAVAMPQAGFGDILVHETIAEQSAAYLFHLNKNHGFIDGNKRVALHCCLLFLEYNGAPISARFMEQMTALSLDVANGRVSKPQVIEVMQRAIDESPT